MLYSKNLEIILTTGRVMFVGMIFWILSAILRNHKAIERAKVEHESTLHWLLATIRPLIENIKNGDHTWRLLKLFSYLLPPPQREDIELSLGDLKKDRRAMERDKFSPWTIQSILLWRAVCIMVPIAWAGLKSFVKEVTPFAKTISRYFGRD